MSTLTAPVVRLVPRQLRPRYTPWSRASTATHWRRGLTYALGTVWLLDAALQFQPYMFTTAFPNEVIAPTAAGNPIWIAGPVRWTAALVGGNVVVLNALFATVQLALAVGLFFAATTRIALAASVAWGLALWWLGEGLGGVLAGPVSPLDGFPGAVVIYALIALVLWPPRPRPQRDPHRRSVADSGALGWFGARAVWLLLWGSFAYEVSRPAIRRPSGLAESIRGMADGEPRWLAVLDHSVAGAVAHRGEAFALGLAAVFVLIAVSALVPSLNRLGVALAVVVSLGIWVVGQNLGAIATGTGTDPNSGLPLALFALCYWPLRRMYPTRN